MSENRVYYGEYSLKHWIDLMLTRNIVLPEYQRTFVWDKNKVRHFFESINNGYYIPPVTIGSFSKDGTDMNLIIDGQQRLTSLLLGCLNLFPKVEYFKDDGSLPFADENDDRIIDEEFEKSVLGWSYSLLLEKNKQNTIESVRKKNLNGKDSKYEEFDIPVVVDSDFLNHHFLGFSYLIPSPDDARAFFSNTFKNLNTMSTPLSPLESRRALYYINEGWEQFFDPKFCHGIKVESGFKTERIDFVRYLSFSFQFLKTRWFGGIAMHYGRRIEEYYSEFIYSVINKIEGDSFAACDDSNKNRFDDLKRAIVALSLSLKTFPSIIDADIYLFGLVYYIVAEKKEIDLSQKDSLIKELENEINTIKTDEYHKKSPAALKYLRKRLEYSITIYGRFVV